MSSADRLLVLPRRLSAEDVERLADVRAGSSGELVLNLDRLHRVEFLADARLLALLTLTRREASVSVRTRYEVDMAAGSIRRLVDLFRDTLAGLVLAQLSERIVDATGNDRRWEVLREQTAKTISAKGFVGFGAEHAAPMVDIFGGPPPAAMVADATEQEFEAEFRSWIGSMHLPQLRSFQLSSLSEFAYETFDNTRRHGVRDLERRPIEGLRFVLLKSATLDSARALGVAERAGGSQLEGYLVRLAEDLPKLTRVIELTVADSGPGIAATMTDALDVHRGDWGEERAVTEKAFQKHRRARRRASGGQGLWKALRAAKDLNGFVAVRTGRSELTQDFFTSQDLEAPWQARERTYLPGTAVSLIFPWSADRT